MSEKNPAKMSGHGKKYSGSFAKVQQGKAYTVEEAFGLLPGLAYAKFDETVDVAINLGVDPKHSDQMVRGAVVLPNGTGKAARIAVIAKGEKVKEAQAAGADYAGSEELIEKIGGGWFEFDKLIATPDMMVAISKIGKLLGPKGLMPNPKLGLVTFDVAKAIQEQKKGKVEYRTEKTGIVHVPVGKKSFGSQKLKENFMSVLSAIVKAKPPTSKGVYLKKITLSSTMSPGVQIDPVEAVSLLPKA